MNITKGRESAVLGGLGHGKGGVHKIINFYFYNDLFRCRRWRILIPPPSPCSGKVDESSFYVSPYELNVNSISDIKTLKPSYQLSFHRRVE
jgi:hypothetical protein